MLHLQLEATGEAVAMSETTYLLTKGATIADFEDSLVLVCGSSIVRFAENQALARQLFEFLDSPRTVKEVATGVPALKDPGRLLDALSQAGVISHSSGLLGELDGLQDFAAATQRLSFDLPAALRHHVDEALASFPALEEALPGESSPVIAIRQTVPEMIELGRELFAAGRCFLAIVPFDGSTLIIGPAVVPGLTACFECLIVRKAALTDWPDEYLRFQNRQHSDQFDAADLNLGLNLAIRLAQGAFYQQMGELIGACTIFDPASLTSYSSRVWSVPRCPTCSKNGKLSTSYPWLKPVPSGTV